jgi:hypothetical protein
MNDRQTMTVKETAKFIGFGREVVAQLCKSGELGFIPAVRPDGSRSRVHKRIPVSEAVAWLRKNTVRSAEGFKKAVDGRRR